VAEDPLQDLRDVERAKSLSTLFSQVLPPSLVARVADSGLSADLADLLGITTRVHDALFSLEPGVSDIQQLSEVLGVVYQELVIHAPFHMESMSPVLEDLLVALEDATDPDVEI